MKNWKKLKHDLLKDPKVLQEYDALSAKFTLIDAVLTLRKKLNLSQKDLASRMSTTQSSIARFESGQTNPTLSFLDRLAEALGKKIKVTLD